MKISKIDEQLGVLHDILLSKHGVTNKHVSCSNEIDRSKSQLLSIILEALPARVQINHSNDGTYSRSIERNKVINEVVASVKKVFGVQE